MSAEEDGRAAPTEPNFELYELDVTPLRQRLSALSDEQSALMRRVVVERGYPKLNDMTWQQARGVGMALTAVESDKAIGGTGPAGIEVKTGVAEKMTDLDARMRQLVTIAFSNYGIPHYQSPLVTVGECQTMAWVLDHPNPAWSEVVQIGEEVGPGPEAVLAAFEGAEVIDAEKSFDERRAEAEAEAAADDDMESKQLERDAAWVQLNDDQPPPADWDEPVPTGAWAVIEEWVRKPLDKLDPDKEQHWERAHRAKVAEIRRRGPKQRKNVMTGLEKILPLGYMPPYLRVPVGTAEEPTVPTSMEMTRLSEGESLHVILDSSGLRYWHEVRADA